MEDTSQPQFHTYFFIESHLSSMDKNIEISIETKHPCVQPLRKILQKTFYSGVDGQQEYITTLYAGDIIASLLKEKEIKTIQGNLRTFPLKLVLKTDKNKFETKINSYLDIDCFMPIIKFDPIKKLVGKNIEPPESIELSPFDYLTIFNDALLLNLSKQINDPSYIEFLKFCIDVLKPLQIIPFKLFLLIYEKIILLQNIDLLNSILDIFEINKIENIQSYDEVINYEQIINMTYTNQVSYIELIKMIPNVDILLYLIKYYTLIIFYYFQLNNCQTIENIILYLRDGNPYDTLIVPKMFLSKYNHFYRSLQINQEIKMSLINGYIQASYTYENLTTAFSMICEYVQGDLNNILTIVHQNYAQINKICVNENNSLQINDFIVQKYEDDLTKVQENLINLGQLKLDNGYKAITFNINMWDVYLENGKNQDFLEFLKSNLIQTSLYLVEIIEALNYIIKYTRKNMTSMLELFTKNYERLETICKNENKCIAASDYLEPSPSDNLDFIKEKFEFIIDNKIKSNFQTLYFKIDLWLYYIVNDFNEEFQLFLEDKLFKGALCYEDICDCLTYGSAQKKRKFSSFIKLIIQNFKKIDSLVKPKKTSIEITKYIDIKEKEDDIQEIFNFIGELIRLEKIKGYKTINFPIKIWEPYTMSQDLDYLRTIRKIIFILSEIDKTLNENDLNLIEKIHNVGFIYIKNGKLIGDRLLEFIGKEEAIYIQKRVNNIFYSNTNRQKELNEHFVKISKLLEKKRKVIKKIIEYENTINQLKKANKVGEENIQKLEIISNDLIRRVGETEKEISRLRSRATF